MIMNREQYTRTAALIGWDGIEKLAEAKVLVFGVGGVGGYVVEALGRAGVGRIDIVDKDTVDISNINRQIIATHDTLERPKVEVMKERLLGINPDIKVEAYETFYLPENAEQFDFSSYDYIVDAVDTVTAKLEIITRAKSLGVPVISAMGAGNKMDPGRLRIADIYKTSVCPLAKVMRKELRDRGIDSLKVVYSDEPPIKRKKGEDNVLGDGRTPGSTPFVPAAAGLLMAAEIVKDILG